jgi:cytochrome P450
LCEYIVHQLECDEEAEEGTMDLIGTSSQSSKFNSLILVGPLIRASRDMPDNLNGQYITKQNVIANAWIFLFAGHETTGNTLHFAFLFLAIALDSQARLQGDIDTVVGTRYFEDWTYEIEMGRLYMSMAGATMNETLRLMPPIVDIPKIVKREPQPLIIEGKTFILPTNMFIHINTVSVHRNPRYWPHGPSKISNKSHDLDDFVPERWLLSANKSAETTKSKTFSNSQSVDGLENESHESSERLFTPTKGAFIPFSEGARACPGRRFAQVEITAVIAAIFQTHTVELDVSEWASDVEVEQMGSDERKAIYEKSKAKARKLIRESETILSLKMLGTNIPVRFVKRGDERFMKCYI